MGHSRSKSTVASPVTTEPGPELMIDPRDINKHLEAMLDRRNIPENQRYKMRNLNDTIKMEFIRQDWAEMQAAKPDRPGTTDSSNSVEGTSAVATGSDCEAEKQKRTRGRSFTFSRQEGGQQHFAEEEQGRGNSRTSLPKQINGQRRQRKGQTYLGILIIDLHHSVQNQVPARAGRLCFIPEEGAAA
uniref:Uncharacterized protein n=1 Tax=Bionectria ochroleuca TaxID=29856 RepID=A0A8H7NEY6_BIOOC